MKRTDGVKAVKREKIGLYFVGVFNEHRGFSAKFYDLTYSTKPLVIEISKRIETTSTFHVFTNFLYLGDCFPSENVQQKNEIIWNQIAFKISSFFFFMEVS